MKRSASLSLALMGSLTLSLTGCGDEGVKEEFITFTSIGECVRSGDFTMQQCQDMAREAQQQTPRFASREECEQAFGIGACGADAAAAVPDAAAAAAPAAAEAGSSLTAEGQHSGGSSWMPLMAGYMMGRYMSGGTAMQGSQPLFRGPEQQPQAGGRSFRTAAGETVRTDAGGRVANPGQTIRKGFAQSAKPFNARTMTSGRGGFGGSSKFGSVGS
jgi:uncharacterized protein YgiB involved in biofilm formation